MHRGLPALPGHMGLCSRSRIVLRGAVWRTQGEQWSAPDRAMARCPRELVQGAGGLSSEGQIATWAPWWGVEPHRCHPWSPGGVDHTDATPGPLAGGPHTCHPHTHTRFRPSRSGNVNQTISRWYWWCWGAGKLEAVFHAVIPRDGADRDWLGPASGSGLRRWVRARLQGHGSADTKRD